MNPADASDPTLAVAERQLAMLAELAEMAMEASRAFKMSAIAASKAETMILGEEWFVPEVGRARACGAKDAAESLQKVSRAVRLTLKLEMTVAEIVRDIRAGKITYINGLASSKDAGETPAVQLEPGSVDRQSLSRPTSRDLAGSYPASDTPDRDRERLDRDPADRESLTEFDRPDIFPHAVFREAVDDIVADLDGEVDWSTGRLKTPQTKAEPLSTVPADHFTLKPPARSPPVPARPPG